MIATNPDLVGLYICGGGMEGVVSAAREEATHGRLAIVCNELTPQNEDRPHRRPAHRRDRDADERCWRRGPSRRWLMRWISPSSARPAQISSCHSFFTCRPIFEAHRGATRRPGATPGGWRSLTRSAGRKTNPQPAVGVIWRTGGPKRRPEAALPRMIIRGRLGDIQGAAAGRRWSRIAAVSLRRTIDLADAPFVIYSPHSRLT